MINLSIPAEYIGEEVEILVFPISSTAQVSSQEEEGRNSRRQEAFQNFMRYKGTLPDTFDCKAALAEYRNERYGHID